MITDYSPEIKIARLLQSILERQDDEWRYIVKFWPNRGKNCAF